MYTCILVCIIGGKYLNITCLNHGSKHLTNKLTISGTVMLELTVLANKTWAAVCRRVSLLWMPRVLFIWLLQ